jgi:hypothetical protein
MATADQFFNWNCPESKESGLLIGQNIMRVYVVLFKITSVCFKFASFYSISKYKSSYRGL